MNYCAKPFPEKPISGNANYPKNRLSKAFFLATVHVSTNHVLQERGLGSPHHAPFREGISSHWPQFPWANKARMAFFHHLHAVPRPSIQFPAQAVPFIWMLASLPLLCSSIPAKRRRDTHSKFRHDKKPHHWGSYFCYYMKLNHSGF